MRKTENIKINFCAAPMLYQLDHSVIATFFALKIQES